MAKVEWHQSYINDNAEYLLGGDGVPWIWVDFRKTVWTIEDSTARILAGPFPTKEAAKLAAEMMYG